MSLIEQIIGKTVTSVTAEDIRGATKIASGVFYKCDKLTTIEFPDTVEEIGDSAFSGCTTLANVDLSNLPRLCAIAVTSFSDTVWYKNLPSGVMLTGENTVLFSVKDVTTIEFPESVLAISGGAMNRAAIPTIVVPDTVQFIYGAAFGNSATTKVVIGTGLSVMKPGSMGDTNVKTWVCKQPADMILNIPQETGDGKGLAWQKDSREFTLYTDNEMLKTYNWSGDNVTATIKPLGEAPT